MTSLMNSLTVMSSPSRPRDSEPLNSYSSPPSSEWKFPGFMNWLSNPSWNATLMSEKIFMQTSLCQVVPPCSLVSLKDSAKKLPPLLHQPWKLRLLLPLKGNSQSGLVVQFFHHCQPSRLCGSLELNMTNQVPVLSTESVSENMNQFIFQKKKNIIKIIYFFIFVS